MLYTAEMLQNDFNLLDIKLLQKLDFVLNEGAYHSGAGYVTRMVAQKSRIINKRIYKLNHKGI
jgi:hypothetical protein